MQVFVPREIDAAETRVAMTPDAATKLIKSGVDVVVEAGLGADLGYDSAAWEVAGVTEEADRAKGIAEADLVARVHASNADEIAKLKAGAIHISFLDAFNQNVIVDAMEAQSVTAVSMEMMPRTTLAQKMDAISSQANLAGYVAVLIGAERLNKILPMMMTPAGTIKPARVFVIGAGVAGLQAIATAKRLGARVDAFDTRPVVKEQVMSLGAKFVEVDLGETGQTKDGYAKELTEEQQALQREAMAKVCAQSDLVITTAKLFARKAPIIVTKEMIAGMQPGSVIVDLAIETGGNVEGAQLNQEIKIDGVHIVGLSNIEGRVPLAASHMYSANIANFITHFWDAEAKELKLNLEDEILAGCVITHDGAIVNQTIKETRANAGA